MSKIYHGIYPDFISLQGFSERHSGIVDVINIQYTDGKHHVYYTQKSDIELVLNAAQVTQLKGLCTDLACDSSDCWRLASFVDELKDGVNK